MLDTRPPKDPDDVNLARLDHQHEQLLRFLEKTNADLMAGNREVKIEDVLRRLVAHTIHHFADEEGLMAMQGFPGLAAHRIEHNALTEKLTFFQAKHEAGEAGVLVSLMQYMQSWLDHHVHKTDKEYEEFFNARGMD